MHTVEDVEAIGMAEQPRIERDIGRLEARADSTDDRLGRIESAQAAMASDIKEILARTNVARGGLRMLITVGTTSATLAAIAIKFLEWWQK